MSSFASFRPVRKAALHLLALFSFLALAACDDIPMMGSGGGSGGPTINASEPVPVALLLPRGSGQPSDAVLSRSLENAARLAMADLKGTRIDLRVYDTAGTSAGGSRAATDAIDNGAKIILGPVYAQAANGAALAAAPRNVNVLAFSNNTTIAGGNLFVLGPTFQNTARRLASYAASQGKSKILIVHSNDVAGQIGKSAIEGAIADSRATLAGTVPYALSQQGVVASVPAVRSAASSSGADAIFMTATTAGALPLFAQLLPESGLGNDVVQYIGLTRWDIPVQTLELPGVQGGWFALPDPASSATFRNRYSAANGEQPHPIGGLAYDGIAAIGALARSGRRDALTRGALTQGAGFQGVGGVFRLRPDGTNERGLAVATIRNKQVVVIDPAPRSFSGAGF